MAHQITLTEEDYAALQAAAQRKGATVETLLHEVIVEQLASTKPKQIGSYQYPTGELDSPEEVAEDEQLASRIRPGKLSLSDMVTEDRGPR